MLSILECLAFEFSFSMKLWYECVNEYLATQLKRVTADDYFTVNFLTKQKAIPGT
jgi:hypothetical protein